MNDFLEFVCENIFNENKDMNKNIEKILNYCHIIIDKIIDKKTKDKYILNLVLEIIYIIDFLNNSLNLMGYSNDIIVGFINEFYKNQNIYNRLLIIKTSNNDEQYTYNKLMEKFKKVDNKFMNEINKLKYEIHCKINEKMIINLKNYGYLDEKVNLTNEEYNKLQEKIECREKRIKLEKIYFKKTENILFMFSKLLVYKHLFAQSIGLSSYFDYKKNSVDNTKDICNLINSLIEQFSLCGNKESGRIKSELLKSGYDDKINQHDMIFYKNKLKSKTLFNPITIINVVIELINKYFGIIMTKTTLKNSLWSENVDVYIVANDGKEIGYLFVDLCNTKKSNIISIKLSKKFDKQNIIITNNIVVIQANYSNTLCITFLQVVELFKEFGSALQKLIQNHSNKMILINDKFQTLFSSIMEFIAWLNIDIICKDYDNIIKQHIIYTRNIDKIYKLKQICINAMFDHIIHSSNSLIEILKTDENPNLVVTDLFKQIYHNIMITQKEFINDDIDGIYPNVISDVITNNECLVYEKIISHVLSYSIYYLILENNDNGKQFTNIILQSNPNDMRKMIYKFISSIPDNYDKYIEYMCK
jgi:hypothetical protein